MYAGTEPSNLYRSEDGGRRWQRLPALRELPSEPRWSFPPRPWTHHVRTIALHPTDPDWLAVGIELGGVMRSLDGGASWIDHNPQAHSDAHQLLTHPLAPDRLYEAAGQGIARSEDRGDDLEQVRATGLTATTRGRRRSTPPTPTSGTSRSAAPRSPPTATATDRHTCGARAATGGPRSTPGATPPELRRMPYALTALPDQPNQLLVGLRGGTLLLSDDAAESWSPLALELDDILDLQASPT